MFMIIAFLLIKFSKPMSKEEAKLSRIQSRKEGGWSPALKLLSDGAYHKSYIIGGILLFIISFLILFLGLYLIFF